jgi:hypothetical protein
MLSTILFLAVLTSGQQPINLSLPPRADARCEGSPWGLGTDNVPQSDDYRTTITGVWSYHVGTSRAAIGWLYVNVSGQYWFQAKLPISPELRGAAASIPVLRLLLNEKSIARATRPVHITVGPREFDASLEKYGIERWQCFTHPFPARPPR